jgi:aminoglycoside phosphotransferase (APT) family kinase protein
MFPVFDGIGLELIRYQVAQHAFKAELLSPLDRSVDQLWRDLWASQRILAKGPRTLLHGDTHIGNTYLLPDGSGGLLDFQLSVRGHWANDVTYLLVTALEPEKRRTHERELIGFYLDELRRQGVAEPPAADEAWRCHRLAVIWGLVIGWLITPPVNYGPEITRANISRLVTACQDLEVFALLK